MGIVQSCWAAPGGGEGKERGGLAGGDWSWAAEVEKDPEELGSMVLGLEELEIKFIQQCVAMRF